MAAYSVRLLHRYRNRIATNNSVFFRRTSANSSEIVVDTEKSEIGNINTVKELSFDELLRESPLMKFGRADQKCVVGRIVDICNDDLYVDFGGKFEAVVKKPQTTTIKDEYKLGTLVRLILNKFEMTGQFLGDEQHITLNEADATLIGHFQEMRKNKK